MADTGSSTGISKGWQSFMQ